MIRINKTYQGNKIVLGVSETDAGNLNVRIVELNGTATSSGRVFRAKNMRKVEEFVRTLKFDETFMLKYAVKPRIEPNKPKKHTLVVVKARMLHLTKYNIVTKDYRRIASSHFAVHLRNQCHEGQKYLIEEGGVKEVYLDKDNMQEYYANGIAIVDIAKEVTMRGANGKGKKMLRAGLKHVNTRVRNYKI